MSNPCPMIAPKPPMGWNSWNTFGPQATQDVVRESAERLVQLGLARLGYRYVVIDDFWEGPERDAAGRLTADPRRFGNGMAALASQVHEQGLKFGIYSCAGTHTCGRQIASYANEQIDAQTFAEWGVDFLKYDFCHVPFGAHGPTLYRRMGQALRATGRPILFSACEWGVHQPWTWARGVGCHMWRTTGDIVDQWGSIVDIGFRKQAGLEQYAGPNGWNDPDMLVVGMRNRGTAAAGGCTDSEYRVHFAHWCMLAAPLMLGCDLATLDPFCLELVSNPSLIAINQDPLGVQARRVMPTTTEWDWDDFPVYAKPMADGSVAVGLYHLNDRDSDVLTAVAFETIGMLPDQRCTVTDVFTGITRSCRGYAERYVPRHDCAVLLVRPE